MYAFFRIIDEAGIRVASITERMGMDRMSFWRVRKGQVPASHQFMQRAKSALRQIGLRKADGSFYTVDELFFDEETEREAAVK